MGTTSRTPKKLMTAAAMFAAIVSGLLGMAATAWSQTSAQTQIPPRATREIDLSGPRFGLTLLSPGTV